MFLIDTNVLVLALNSKQPEANFLQKISKKDKLFISVITLAEFLSKASRSERGGFKILSTVITLLDVDEQTAGQAASYRSKFLKSSRTKLLDYLIAAQAKLHKLTLVTNNKSDFPMRDIKILKPA